MVIFHFYIFGDTRYDCHYWSYGTENWNEELQCCVSAITCWAPVHEEVKRVRDREGTKPANEGHQASADCFDVNREYLQAINPGERAVAFVLLLQIYQFKTSSDYSSSLPQTWQPKGQGPFQLSMHLCIPISEAGMINIQKMHVSKFIAITEYNAYTSDIFLTRMPERANAGTHSRNSPCA